MQRIQVGNRQYVSVLFIIPMIVDIHDHRFEAFTLVSELHENVDFVFGLTNIFELEGVIDLHESCFNFLNRSIPFFSKEQVILKPKEQKYITLEAPFVEKNLRHGHSENVGQIRASYSYPKIEIH